MTLTEFLLARIAEDEAVAREAIEDDGGSDEGFSGQYAALIEPPSGVGIAQGGFGEAAALMIATYAVPARVLAECEAKRQIVEAHGPDHECISLTGRGDRSVVDGKPWALWELQHTADAGRPCYVLRCLALPYADHPDYREAWRPSE